MARYKDAKPQISVRLHKTISRETVDGQRAVSARYAGKDESIDLTPFLGDGSSVITSKSVREPCGGFSITFADRPYQSVISAAPMFPTSNLESIYGLIEPMDMIEIRMWGGVGARPSILPIKMRGFVGDVRRSQSVAEDGKPIRQVAVTGHDYGKIWQIYQVLYLRAYALGDPLLTTFNLWEQFDFKARNTMPAAEFVREMVDRIINPFIDNFMPDSTEMPRRIETGDSISVAHGVINNSYQEQQGSIYDILKLHGDVGVWNELYTEDREDGVHCVYRPTPALHVTRPEGQESALIQDDAPEPVFVEVPDEDIQLLNVHRSDSNVANFYWVNNQRYDLIDDLWRKLYTLGPNSKDVNADDHPNSSAELYGVRQMYADTQQGDDRVANASSGQPEDKQSQRGEYMEEWITKRRRLMMEMNRDNVVLESGNARIKGGPMRPDGLEAMKAGDYARFKTGNLESQAYVTQITDEFIPFHGYTTSLSLERSTGFVERMTASGSPWLTEQSRR